jgi:hypothetical protein
VNDKRSDLAWWIQMRYCQQPGGEGRGEKGNIVITPMGSSSGSAARCRSTNRAGLVAEFMQWHQTFRMLRQAAHHGESVMMSTYLHNCKTCAPL